MTETKYTLKEIGQLLMARKGLIGSREWAEEAERIYRKKAAEQGISEEDTQNQLDKIFEEARIRRLQEIAARNGISPKIRQSAEHGRCIQAGKAEGIYPRGL